ncbi:MAG: DUF6880 family protein [Phycisphaeraceae bacterium]
MTTNVEAANDTEGLRMSGLTDDKLKKLLAKRGKVELVDWIMEQSANNEDLRRVLVSFVAPQADIKTLVSELNQIIKEAWGRTRTSKEPWKLARPIAADLEPVLPVLEQLIERGHAADAEKLLRRLVEAADKGFDHVDDSYGYLGPLCQDAVTLWGKAWAKIEPHDPAVLAQLVHDDVRDNGYAIRDHMIRDFALALGRDGLLALKEMFLAEHKANLADKGLDDWERHEPLRHLADVADALGDVDMYIDAQRQCGVENVYALPIARRLLDAGRPSEALEYLNRTDPSRSHFQGENDDCTALRVKILQALGRDEEARDTLWQEFRRGLGTTSLERLLASTPKEQQQALINEAIEVADAHSDKLTAATFLLGRGHADRAAATVDAHPDKFDGRYYGSLLPLAEAFQKDFPESAWVLYRSLLLSILEEKRSKAYHHAADYLAIADDLAARTGLHEKHQALLSLLNSKHGRKYGFWSLVKK